MFNFFKKDSVKVENTSSKSSNTVETKVFNPQKKNLIVNAYGLMDSPDKVIVLPEIDGIVISKILEDGDYVEVNDPILIIDLGAKKSRT